MSQNTPPFKYEEEKRERGMAQVNRDMMEFSQRKEQEETATLDMDASVVETKK